MTLHRTPEASRMLGVSDATLKRMRDSHGGYLILGKHYFLLPSRNAAIRWDVEAIEKEFSKRRFH